MSPRTLDPATVHAKLRALRDLLADLEPLSPTSGDDLRTDRLVRHAVERILTQMVDLAVAVNSHLAAATLGRGPSDYRESFSLAVEVGAINADLADQLKPSVGLRNVLTHEYVQIDLDVVADSIPGALRGYRSYVKQVARYLTAKA